MPDVKAVVMGRRKIGFGIASERRHIAPRTRMQVRAASRAARSSCARVRGRVGMGEGGAKKLRPPVSPRCISRRRPWPARGPVCSRGARRG